MTPVDTRVRISIPRSEDLPDDSTHSRLPRSTTRSRTDHHVLRRLRRRNSRRCMTQPQTDTSTRENTRIRIGHISQKSSAKHEEIHRLRKRSMGRRDIHRAKPQHFGRTKIPRGNRPQSSAMATEAGTQERATNTMANTTRRVRIRDHFHELNGKVRRMKPSRLDCSPKRI